MKTLLFLASLVLAAGGVWAQEPSDLVKQGQQLFENHCAQCHLKNGQGLPGTFPALNKNALVVGDPNPVIAIVLNGRKGALGRMPAWKDQLTGQQTAAVVTYIRQAWANRAPAVTPDMVAEVQKIKK